MGNLLPRILGWLTVIISLALAPTLNTQNAAVDAAHVAANLSTSMIGLGTVVDFGAPLMIISLLFAGTMLGLGKIGDGSIKGMLGVIGMVIVTIVALSMFESVIGYVNTLLEASSGFALVIYGVIPIILYITIVSGAGAVTAYKAVRGRKSSRKSSTAY